MFQRPYFSSLKSYLSFDDIISNIDKILPNCEFTEQDQDWILSKMNDHQIRKNIELLTDWFDTDKVIQNSNSNTLSQYFDTFLYEKAGDPRLLLSLIKKDYLNYKQVISFHKDFDIEIDEIIINMSSCHLFKIIKKIKHSKTRLIQKVIADFIINNHLEKIIINYIEIENISVLLKYANCNLSNSEVEELKEIMTKNYQYYKKNNLSYVETYFGDICWEDIIKVASPSMVIKNVDFLVNKVEDKTVILNKLNHEDICDLISVFNCKSFTISSLFCKLTLKDKKINLKKLCSNGISF